MILIWHVAGSMDQHDHNGRGMGIRENAEIGEGANYELRDSLTILVLYMNDSLKGRYMYFFSPLSIFLLSFSLYLISYRFPSC